MYLLYPFESFGCFDITLPQIIDPIWATFLVLAYVWLWETRGKRVKKFEGTFVTVAQNLISFILKVVGVVAVVNAIRQRELLAIID